MKPTGHGPTCFCADCRGDEEGGETLQLGLYEVIQEVKQRIRNITDFIKENCDMLPNAEDNGQPQGGRRTRPPAGTIPYLKNEDLSTTPKKFKIVAMKYDGENKYGARVVLKLVGDGRTVFWGVNIKKNPNYKTLLDRFGREEDNWLQQEIMLFLQEDSFDNQYYVHVSFSTTTSGEGAGTRRSSSRKPRGEEKGEE